MASVAFFLAQRAKALRHGDAGQVRAINADLARLGYVESPPVPEAASGAPVAPTPETTSIELPERAVPASPRRRRPAAR